MPLIFKFAVFTISIFLKREKERDETSEYIIHVRSKDFRFLTNAVSIPLSLIVDEKN